MTFFWRLSSARETGALSGSDMTEAHVMQAVDHDEIFDQQTKVPRGFCVLPVARRMHLLPQFPQQCISGHHPYSCTSDFHLIRLVDVHVMVAFVKPVTRLYCHYDFGKYCRTSLQILALES